MRPGRISGAQRDMLRLVYDSVVKQVMSEAGWEMRFPPGFGGKAARATFRICKRREWVRAEGTGKPDVQVYVLTETGRAALLLGRVS